MLLFGPALRCALPSCLSVCVLLCLPGASDALWRRLHGVSLIVRLCWSQQFCLSSELDGSICPALLAFHHQCRFGRLWTAVKGCV